jgi:hypothetical protein
MKAYLIVRFVHRSSESWGGGGRSEGVVTTSEETGSLLSQGRQLSHSPLSGMNRVFEKMGLQGSSWERLQGLGWISTLWVNFHIN